MCLIIHSKGHITIKAIYEQIWPQLNDTGVAFVHCYDFFIRNHSNEPLREFYILNPNAALDAGRNRKMAFDLLSEVAMEDRNWFLSENSPIPNSSEEVRRICFRSPYDNVNMRIDVARLVPQLVPHPLCADQNVYALLYGTGMTLSVVKFLGDRTIERFESNSTTPTTYWLRLAFRPHVRHRITPAIKFGRGQGTTCFNIQPCTILSSGAVLDSLSAQAHLLAEHAAFSDTVPHVQKILDVFRQDGTSTRIEDYRISVVTNERFWLWNPQVEGPCGAVGLEPIERPKGHVARTWFTGANYYPMTDPMTLARHVYLHLAEFATQPKTAKTKEQISAALAPDYHSNVSHIVDALADLDFLACVDGVYFYTGTRTSVFDTMDFGAREAEVRTKLYGSLKTQGSARLSVFRPKPFRISYDLAYAEGGAQCPLEN